MFGANAVGGTINIITKDPINTISVFLQQANINGKVWEQYGVSTPVLVKKNNTYGIGLYQSYRNRNPYDGEGEGYGVGKAEYEYVRCTYYRPTEFSRISLNIKYYKKYQES